MGQLRICWERTPSIKLDAKERLWLYDLIRSADTRDYPEDVQNFYRTLRNRLNDL